MLAKDFFYYYDLLDLDILKIYVNKETSCLDIILSMPIRMDYIANGLRSDFDYTKVHTFSFKNYECDSNLKLINPIIISKYELINETIVLVANKNIIKIM